MAKKTDDSVLDAALNVLVNNTENMVLCSAEPTDFTNVSTVALAAVAMAPTDFTNANGDVSGRKTTIATKTGINVTTTGTATHVALTDDSASTLLYVTTAPSTTVDSSGTVDIGSWKVELADPS